MFVAVTMIALATPYMVEPAYMTGVWKYPYTMIPSVYAPVDMVGGFRPSFDVLQRELVNDLIVVQEQAKREKRQKTERKIIVEVVARDRLFIETTTKRLEKDRDKLSAADLFAITELLRITRDNLRHYERFLEDHPGIERDIAIEIELLKK